MKIGKISFFVFLFFTYFNIFLYSEEKITTVTLVNLENLEARFKSEDVNENKQWDTGNYIQKIQPEKVIYYWKEIDLRANWDMNEIFNTNENYPDLQESATVSDVLEVQDNPTQQ